LIKQIEIPYNFTLRPFQVAIWNAPQKNKVLVIPRRHGKTSLAINWLISEAIQNANKVYWYICPTIKQAKEVVWKAPEMLGMYLPLEAIKTKNEVELTIYLKNGSQIHVKGADNPDSLRGTNPFGVIIDEYAQIKKELYDEILMPILKANGGWIWLMGTPKGKNDFYKKLNLHRSNPEWQTVHLKASEAHVLSEAILREAREVMTEASFNQEFECEFLEGSGSVFRRIKENASAMVQEPLPGTDYVVGVDLARLVDWTVLTVVNTKTWEVVFMDRFNQIDWNLQKARIESLARRYNNALIRIDATGIGDPIVSDLTAQGLMVEPFTLTNQTKSQLISSLALALEQDKLKILPDRTTIEELEAYTYERLANGVVRYNAPSGQHDDCVISLALAAFKLPEKLINSYNGLMPDIETFAPSFNQFGEPIYT
jgi:phage FluMu gp28-like protein